MPRWMFRPLTAALLVACAALAALPGCGKPAPSKADGKGGAKDDPRPGADPGAKGSPGPGASAPPAPKSTLGDVEPAADQAATAFLTDLVQGKAQAASLSASFVKVVGKPLVLPSEREQGFSADNAASWLRKVGEGVTIGLALKRQQAGDVVYIRGGIGGTRFGPGQTGGYSLRLVREGGAWKVDWLSLTSAEATATPAVPTPEAAAQEFAVVAFAELLADLHGTPQEQRAPLLAAAVTPELRARWAPPFDQDKAQGYDFNPVEMHKSAVKVGGGTSSFTVARVGDLPEFTLVLTKPAGKKAYTVKLVKGAGANEWLVSEVSEQKG